LDFMKTVVVAVLGVLLLLAGVALLVLPGPGFVLIAAGLSILATRFNWARKPLDYAKGKADQGVQEVGQSKLKATLALVCALGLIVIGILALIGLDVPFVSAITAVLLILSGLFLLGTIVYARFRHQPTNRRALL